MARRSRSPATPAPAPASPPPPEPPPLDPEDLPWPARVPVLGAADLRSRPLWGWLGRTFSGGRYDRDDPRTALADLAWDALMAVQRRELGLRRALSLSEFARRHDPAAQADLWNRAMRQLGYDVPAGPA